MENKELNTNDLEQVSGGSIFNRESSIRDAGIELRYEDGTPGSFGIFYNSGDYYFQNRHDEQPVRLQHPGAAASENFLKLYCHPGKCCVSIHGKEKAARAVTDD